MLLHLLLPNSSCLLFLELGPNGLDALRHLWIHMLLQHFVKLIDQFTIVLLVYEVYQLFDHVFRRQLDLDFHVLGG